MTESDISKIESQLDIRVPDEYRQFIASPSSQRIPGILHDAQEVIDINLRNRQASWLGRPLNQVFFIFATDARGREVFIDLEIPGWLVMAAAPKRKCSRALARTFHEWVAKETQMAVRKPWALISGLVLSAFFLVIDFFPRYGPSDFRYTESDPSVMVWNLGLPCAHWIYDERLSEPWIRGPLVPGIYFFEFFILIISMVAMATVTYVKVRQPLDLKER